MRRLHLNELQTGQVALSPDQCRHALRALRLTPGDAVELFDDAGRTAQAVLLDEMGNLRVDSIQTPAESARTLVIASALPKGPRADWMIEKISELGCAQFIPLQTRRSVVHPAGEGKLDRWERIARESAKQSRRTGVMRIDPLCPLPELLKKWTGAGVFFTTSPACNPVHPSQLPKTGQFLIAIGPEGGWDDSEEQLMLQRGWIPASLGETILRVETAAVAAAAICLLNARN